MKPALQCLASILLLLGFCACSSLIATRQPPKRDLAVLDPGTPRAKVIAELGRPLLTETRRGRIVDVFAFRQGYSKANRTTRSLLHGAAAVATLGLWEIVATPTEGLFDGKEIQVELYYDDLNRVQWLEPLNKGLKVKKIQHRPPTEMTMPVPMPRPLFAPSAGPSSPIEPYLPHAGM